MSISEKIFLLPFTWIGLNLRIDHTNNAYEKIGLNLRIGHTNAYEKKVEHLLACHCLPAMCFFIVLSSSIDKQSTITLSISTLERGEEGIFNAASLGST